MADTETPGEARELNVGDKFDFLVLFFSEHKFKGYAGQRKLTSLRAAILTHVVHRFNLKWGYSRASEREIAASVGCPQRTVSAALKWLRDEGALIRVRPGNSRDAAGYAPNFSRYACFDLCEYALDVIAETTPNASSLSTTPSTSSQRLRPARSQKGTKRTERKRKEVSPSPAGGRRPVGPAAVGSGGKKAAKEISAKPGKLNVDNALAMLGAG